MNKLALTFTLAAALLPTVIFSSQPALAQQPDHAEAYVVQLPIKRQATKLVALEGEFRPSKYTQIVSENSGKIADIYVHDGDQVQQGDPLLKFDTTLAKLAVKAAEEEYRMATRNIIELTRKTNERDPRYAMASRAVEQTRSNLLQAQKDQQETIIYAPFTGKLGQIHLSVGNYINQGDVVTELVATDTVELHFNASPQVLDTFRQVLNSDSDNLQALIPHQSGNYYRGQLKYIDIKLSEQGKTLDGYAEFNNDNGAHLIGSRTTFFLNSPTPQPQLFIPVAALHNQDGITNVFVLDEERVVRRKTVTLATIKEHYSGYLPIQDGLEPDDFVLTSPDAPSLVGKKVAPIVDLVNQLNEVINRQK